MWRNKIPGSNAGKSDKWQRQQQYLWCEIFHLCIMSWVFVPLTCLPLSSATSYLHAVCSPVAARVRKKAKPKRKKKGLFCDFFFLSFVGDRDWALSQTSGLWQRSRERSALQATKHKGRERVPAIKHRFKGWNICLDCIIKITGKYAS